jgi:hypothetical protein
LDFITVKLPEGANVTLLEDSEMRITWFQKRIPNLTVCRNVQEFKDHFTKNPPCDFVFWDHDLGEGANGADAAKWFLERYGSTNRAHLIHSFNRAGARNIQQSILNACHVPFGEFEIEFV